MAMGAVPSVMTGRLETLEAYGSMCDMFVGGPEGFIICYIIIDKITYFIKKIKLIASAELC